jgi:CubicO group peptidase (beta-lactamase class C family)
MARWLRFQLANGVLDGRRIADAAVIQETHTPHTPIRITPEMASKVPWGRRADYCLGWVLIDHQGDHVVYHNGEIDGIYAVIGFVPERQVGAVVLTNYQNQRLSDVVFLQALDVLLDHPPKDWNSIYLGNRKKQEAEEAEARQVLEASRVRGTTPSHPVAAYAGDYENEMYGRVAVSLEGDHLVLRLGSQLIADLAHWHYETFRARMRDRALEAIRGATLITFGTGAKGAVSSMNLGDALLFERVPEQKPGAAK